MSGTTAAVASALLAAGAGLGCWRWWVAVGRARCAAAEADAVLVEWSGTLAALPRPAGRHRAIGETAADQIGRPGWSGAHSEDRLPEPLRAVTMEWPVVKRANILAWTNGITWRPAEPPPPRLRRAQLLLAARLRAAGVPTALRPRLGEA